MGWGGGSTFLEPVDGTLACVADASAALEVGIVDMQVIAARTRTVSLYMRIGPTTLVMMGYSPAVERETIAGGETSKSI
jgi:hypothetical protein